MRKTQPLTNKECRLREQARPPKNTQHTKRPGAEHIDDTVEDRLVGKACCTDRRRHVCGTFGSNTSRTTRNSDLSFRRRPCKVALASASTKDKEADLAFPQEARSRHTHTTLAFRTHCSHNDSVGVVTLISSYKMSTEGHCTLQCISGKALSPCPRQ